MLLPSSSSIFNTYIDKRYEKYTHSDIQILKESPIKISEKKYLRDF